METKKTTAKKGTSKKAPGKKATAKTSKKATLKADLAGNDVKFNATVTGTISNLDVAIQGLLVPSPGNKVTFSQNVTGNILTVDFQISGLNGTAFTITYTCTSNGKAVSDAANPSPVTGTIVSNGNITVTLTIPL